MSPRTSQRGADLTRFIRILQPNCTRKVVGWATVFGFRPRTVAQLSIWCFDGIMDKRSCLVGWGGSVAGELTFDGYEEYLGGLKARIRAAQIRSALAVNRELVALYWQIGRDVLRQQRRQGWGSKVIDRLSGDLRREFPEIKGFSVRNLKYMRAFAEAYPDKGFVQQLAAQIPWFHNCAILDAVKEPAARAWYVRQTIAQGWSRSVLTHQIDAGLFERQGGAATNFAATLPSVQSDLAQQALKDSYLFDFLSLGPAARERI